MTTLFGSIHVSALAILSFEAIGVFADMEDFLARFARLLVVYKAHRDRSKEIEGKAREKP